MSSTGAPRTIVGSPNRVSMNSATTDIPDQVGKRNASASPLRSERGPLLCAPLPHSLRIDGLTGTNDAIDCVTLKQLRAGILERCFPGRLTTSHVALIDCTMQQPFRHFFSLAVLGRFMGLCQFTAA